MKPAKHRLHRIHEYVPQSKRKQVFEVDKYVFAQKTRDINNLLQIEAAHRLDCSRYNTALGGGMERVDRESLSSALLL